AVGDTRGPDAGEDRVEFLLAHAEADVMTLELLSLGEIERQRLVDVHRGEVALRLRPGRAEKSGQALRPVDPIARRHDDVIELDGHGAPPPPVWSSFSPASSGRNTSC